MTQWGKILQHIGKKTNFTTYKEYLEINKIQQKNDQRIYKGNSQKKYKDK